MAVPSVSSALAEFATFTGAMMTLKLLDADCILQAPWMSPLVEYRFEISARSDLLAAHLSYDSNCEHRPLTGAGEGCKRSSPIQTYQLVVRIGNPPSTAVKIQRASPIKTSKFRP
jgi:hypothetical protein